MIRSGGGGILDGLAFWGFGSIVKMVWVVWMDGGRDGGRDGGGSVVGDDFYTNPTFKMHDPYLPTSPNDSRARGTKGKAISLIPDHGKIGIKPPSFYLVHDGR